MFIGLTDISAQIKPDLPTPVRNKYFYEPYPLEPGVSVFQLGASFTLLPLPIVENEYPVPAVDIQYKRGIFNNFSLVASLSTNFFGNLLHTGIQWNVAADRISFGLANHVGGFYGFMSSEDQFDNNTAYAIYDLPIMRLGIRFDDFSASMTWAASYVFNSYNKVGGIKAPGPRKSFNDIFCTLAVEQPFLKHSYISIGFSVTYARSPYQAWLLYNTIDQYLFIPEFFFAVQL